MKTTATEGFEKWRMQMTERYLESERYFWFSKSWEIVKKLLYPYESLRPALTYLSCCGEHDFAAR